MPICPSYGLLTADFPASTRGVGIFADGRASPTVGSRRDLKHGGVSWPGPPFTRNAPCLVRSTRRPVRGPRSRSCRTARNPPGRPVPRPSRAAARTRNRCAAVPLAGVQDEPARGSRPDRHARRARLRPGPLADLGARQHQPVHPGRPAFRHAGSAAARHAGGTDLRLRRAVLLPAGAQPAQLPPHRVRHHHGPALPVHADRLSGAHLAGLARPALPGPGHAGRRQHRRHRRHGLPGRPVRRRRAGGTRWPGCCCPDTSASSPACPGTPPSRSPPSACWPGCSRSGPAARSWPPRSSPTAR